MSLIEGLAPPHLLYYKTLSPSCLHALSKRLPRADTTAPFPEGYGASIHFSWPSGPFVPLGVLTNTKPSAIYRVRSLLPAGQAAPQPGQSPPASLGIEIAPLSQLEAVQSQTSEVGRKGREVAERVEVGKVAEKVVKNVCLSLARREKESNTRVRGKEYTGM